MVKFVKRIIKSIVWRLRNRKNSTTLAGDYFPLNKVQVGQYTYGSLHVVSYGSSNESLTIGDFCSIADDVVFLLGGGHSLDTFSTYPFEEKFEGRISAASKGPIVVKDDVWIGFRATILSGVTLGQGCVVGAGAVVCNDIPPYAVVGGIPAKVLKYRFDEKIRNDLMSIDYDKMDSNFILQHRDLLTRPLTDRGLETLEVALGRQIVSSDDGRDVKRA
ncbi:CatB-related O-acetyltransferase [Bifidobacterium pseudolongum]|uniref:CatB-related O-acetyltransferase n=1 Tax=Bifidobacterium pseudolongum TaxID=1694 RepID=UPI0009BE6879|nr:CatB-related O-acetyltransferase [Bifidobacterium pseudolongum]